MFTRRSDTRVHRLAFVIAVSLIAAATTPLAVARIVFNTIDALAIVADEGRHLVVSGPLTCTPGEQTILRVTVTQRATGAIAEGQTLVVCSGAAQEWVVHAAIHGRESFQLGPAIAVAVARTAARGDTTDAHQWLVPITLVAE
jgi:hypothetical protein